MNIKKITNIGVLIALSFILMVLIKFPIIPSLPFLLYDPGDIPLLVISFLYGPLPALIATFIGSILMALFTGLGGPYGAIMHFMATGALVTTAGFIYKKYHTKKGAILGLSAGTLAMTFIMIPANLFITPIYMGLSRQQIYPLLWSGIIPFNLIKASINSGITILVYKNIASFLREKGLLPSVENI
ncbi:MAG: ECF transporter S component [Bacillota bacterium]